MKHGLAGFQKGCRCGQCCEAEAQRVRRIGRSETERWAAANEMADQRWALYVGEYNACSMQPRSWVPREVSIIVDPSISIPQAAAILGRSLASVSMKRHRLAVEQVIR